MVKDKSKKYYRFLRLVYFLIIIIFSLGNSIVFGETVSQKQASYIAQQFFNAAHRQVMAKPKLVYNGKRLTTDHLFSPFYVYNHSTGGFVIISAENKAFPILAYSLTDTFNPDDISAPQKKLLTEYALDIEQIRYDGRIPYYAIIAWENIQEYINGLLNANLSVSDFGYNVENNKEKLISVMYSEEFEQLISSIYSPEQWCSMIDIELATSSYVSIGFIDKDTLQSATIYGKKGDMYSIDFIGKNSSYYRLMATEYLSSGQFAVLGNVPERKIEPEEAPFAFYDAFIKDINQTEKDKQSAIENASVIIEPRIRAIGSGQYTIELPEYAALATVYSISGALLYKYTYGNTNAPHIDISNAPNGFYFLQILGKSGQPYGFKIIR